MKKSLIVYGTRYGSTEEISKEIAKILREHEIEVELINLEETKVKNLPPLENFDGILVGSSIKIGKMTKHIRKFLEKNEEMLKARENILGLFVSCGTAGDPEKRGKAKKDYINKVLNEKNLEADLSEAFGGVFDLSEESNLGFFSKKIMEATSKDDPNITAGEKNDQRDWNRIKEFANRFCEQLTSD
ncbi:MAG: hypothetical protein BAJALOKI2v1_130018 [Promethearchaeota archaeon]|nr:MAG: hypothetical protein BAJALOKI2v1_130018 [Candidatus Lokiarchaeota archaeon]